MKISRAKIIIVLAIILAAAIPLKIHSEIKNRRVYLQKEYDIAWIPKLTNALGIMHIRDMPGAVGLLADSDRMQKITGALADDENDDFSNLSFTGYFSGAQCVTNTHQAKLRVLRKYASLSEERMTDEASINDLLKTVKNFTSILEECRSFSLGST